MELVKQLSLLLEFPTEPTIYSILNYFLILLYEKLETSPKRHVVACAMFSTFLDTFTKKLLMLLDDVEQLLFWVVAAMLDGRRIGFDWLNPMWENKREWPKVTKQFRSVHHFILEVEQHIADQVRVGLLLSMSIPLKCGPQAPNLLLGSHVVGA